MARKKARKYTFEELWNPQINLQSAAAAYGRQSTKEQVIENIQSHISQTIGLLKCARELGFKDDGSTGKVTLFIENEVVDKDGNKTIKNASGTWPIDKRPDLKTIIDLIEEDKIKLVIVEFVDRLFRDEDRIDSNIFIKACKEHDCFVYVTSKKMIYNFANPQMAEMFRMEIQFAAAYIEHHIRGTMLRRRDQAVSEGQYGGGYVPMGFVICKDKGDKYNKRIPYPPHAKIIKELAIKVLQLGLIEVSRQAAKDPIIFPNFEDGVEPGHRSLDKVENGYILRSRVGLIQLLKNRANIGDIVYGNIKVVGAHDPILDKELYEALLRKMRGDSSRKRYTHKDSKVVRVGILKRLIASKKWRACAYAKTGEHYHYCFNNTGMVTETGLCISADLIESLVEDRLIEKIRACDLGSFEEELKERQVEKTKRLKDINTRLLAIDEEVSNLTDSLVKTKVQSIIDKINEKVVKFEQEIERLKEERSNLEQSVEAIDLSLREELSKLSNVIGKKPAKIRQTILEFMINKITVDLASSRYIQISVEWKISEFGIDEIYIDRGANQSIHWTAEELLTLKEKYPTIKSTEILKALPNRNWSAIRRKAHQEGLKRHKKDYRIGPNDLSWSDLDFLRRNGDFPVGKWRQMA